MNAQAKRPSRLRWVLAGLVGFLVILVLGYAAASFVVYDQVGKAPQACWPGDARSTPAAFKVPAPFPQDLVAGYQMPAPQDVTFASRDPQIPDAKLAGWWIPGADPKGPAVVLVHGVQSCRREAIVLLAAGMLHRAGFSVFLMDLRDHGDSEGDDARFAGGSEEYMDVLGGWDWVRERGVPPEKIGVAGFSFGAISAIVAGAQEPQVPAVFSDSSTTTMSDGIGLFLADQVHDPTGISKVLVPGAVAWAKVIANDDLTRFNPVDEVAAYDGRQIAFVHGEKDKVLPASMAVELHDAAAAAGAITPEAWIVPDAGHTQGIYYDPAGYEQRLVSFFTAALGAR
jgi:uncharacterized protein